MITSLESAEEMWQYLSKWPEEQLKQCLKVLDNWEALPDGSVWKKKGITVTNEWEWENATPTPETAAAEEITSAANMVETNSDLTPSVHTVPIKLSMDPTQEGQQESQNVIALINKWTKAGTYVIMTNPAETRNVPRIWYLDPGAMISQISLKAKHLLLRNLTRLGKARVICETATGKVAVDMELYRLHDLALFNPHTGKLSHVISTDVLVNSQLTIYDLVAGRNTIQDMQMITNYVSQKVVIQSGAEFPIVTEAKATLFLERWQAPANQPRWRGKKKSKRAKRFYPVAVGNKPGIYLNDAEARRAYETFPDAVHTGTKTLEDAIEFMEEECPTWERIKWDVLPLVASPPDEQPLDHSNETGATVPREPEMTYTSTKARVQTSSFNSAMISPMEPEAATSASTREGKSPNKTEPIEMTLAPLKLLVHSPEDIQGQRTVIHRELIAAKARPAYIIMSNGRGKKPAPYINSVWYFDPGAQISQIDTVLHTILQQYLTPLGEAEVECTTAMDTTYRKFHFFRLCYCLMRIPEKGTQPVYVHLTVALNTALKTGPILGRNGIDAFGFIADFAHDILTDTTGTRIELLPRREANSRSARQDRSHARIAFIHRPWYPVAVGHSPGIYDNDKDARVAYEGYPKPKHRKCLTYENARNWIADVNLETPGDPGSALLGSIHRTLLLQNSDDCDSISRTKRMKAKAKRRAKAKHDRGKPTSTTAKEPAAKSWALNRFTSKPLTKPKRERIPICSTSNHYTKKERTHAKAAMARMESMTEEDQNLQDRIAMCSLAYADTQHESKPYRRLRRPAASSESSEDSVLGASASNTTMHNREDIRSYFSYSQGQTPTTKKVANITQPSPIDLTLDSDVSPAPTTIKEEYAPMQTPDKQISSSLEATACSDSTRASSLDTTAELATPGELTEASAFVIPTASPAAPDESLDHVLHAEASVIPTANPATPNDLCNHLPNAASISYTPNSDVLMEMTRSVFDTPSPPITRSPDLLQPRERTNDQQHTLDAFMSQVQIPGLIPSVAGSHDQKKDGELKRAMQQASKYGSHIPVLINGKASL
jgi:viroplasmin and RNaseH domain-containing protein